MQVNNIKSATTESFSQYFALEKFYRRKHIFAKKVTFFYYIFQIQALSMKKWVTKSKKTLCSCTLNIFVIILVPQMSK